jgi:HK97 family phage portal protein
MRGVIDSVFGGAERKSGGFPDGMDIWQRILGGEPVKSGVTVNVNTALQVTTVLACARRIAEALMVPRKIYQRDPDTHERKERRQHPLYEILEDAPNQWQSGLEYMETIGFHLSLTFNHYSLINRIKGSIDELIPLEPSKVNVLQGKDGSLRYRVNLLDNTYAIFEAQDIWHIRGPSWNGSTGMDALRLAREAVGLAIATEESHARLHSNGGQPGGILTTDKELKKDARARIREQFTQAHVGVANKFKTAVLDNGLKFQTMAATGVESQHIQLRYLQIEEICRGQGVMPIMVGHTADKAATYASSEQMFLAHLVHTVRPTHDRVAASAKRWLLTKKERAEGYYLAFSEGAFLSPAMKDKAEYYKIATGGAPWLTPDQVRGFDEMPRQLGGDRLYIPMNIIPIGDDGFPRPNVVKPPAAPTAGNSGA